jgi:hypothetical protein
MTILTIQVPDSEMQDISNYVRQKGGQIVAEVSLSSIRRSQKLSLKKGLTEAILIERGEMKAKPLSDLWDE